MIPCSFGECVLVIQHPNGWVHLGDTKHPGQEYLRFSPDEWAAFVAVVKAGNFDTNATGRGVITVCATKDAA